MCLKRSSAVNPWRDGRVISATLSNVGNVILPFQNSPDSTHCRIMSFNCLNSPRESGTPNSLIFFRIVMPSFTRSSLDFGGFVGFPMRLMLSE